MDYLIRKRLDELVTVNQPSLLEVLYKCPTFKLTVLDFERSPSILVSLRCRLMYNLSPIFHKLIPRRLIGLTGGDERVTVADDSLLNVPHA